MKCISASMLLLIICCEQSKSSNGIRSLSPTIMSATHFTVPNSSRRLLARTRLQCVNACFQSTLCQTMNYFAGQSYCDLFDQSIDQGQLLIDATAETIYCFNGCTCQYQQIRAEEILNATFSLLQINADLHVSITASACHPINVFVLRGILE